jgi:hypothetical protein
VLPAAAHAGEQDVAPPRGPRTHARDRSVDARDHRIVGPDRPREASAEERHAPAIVEGEVRVAREAEHREAPPGGDLSFPHLTRDRRSSLGRQRRRLPEPRAGDAEAGLEVEVRARVMRAGDEARRGDHAGHDARQRGAGGPANGRTDPALAFEEPAEAGPRSAPSLDGAQATAA